MDSKITGLYLIIAIILVFSLYWYIRARRLESKVLDIENLSDITKTWEKEYNALICAYGTVDNFIEAHMEDFNIIRSNILVFIARLERLSMAIGMSLRVLDSMLDDVEETKYKKDQVVKLKEVRRELSGIEEGTKRLINNNVEELVKFIESEVEAHNKGGTDINKVLNEVRNSEYVKDVDFFDV